MQGSGGNVKKTFIDALKLTKPKKTKKRSKRSMPKMKSDIEYSSIFNIKDNTTSGGNSTNP